MAALIERLPTVRRADKLRPSMPPSPPSDSNSKSRIQPRSLGGFWALIAAVQFQGAFSDNALQVFAGPAFLCLTPPSLEREARSPVRSGCAAALCRCSFRPLFSIPGGYLADMNTSKRSVTLWTKVFELAVMGLATYALASNRLEIAGVALFLACTQGAIFGPTKYGLLPELLPLAKLKAGATASSNSAHCSPQSAPRSLAAFWRRHFTAARCGPASFFSRSPCSVFSRASASAKFLRPILLGASIGLSPRNFSTRSGA